MKQIPKFRDGVERYSIGWATVELEGQFVEFNVKMFKKLLGPGVYVINGIREVLYVGMARNLLSRISSPDHEAVLSSLKEPVEQVIMIPCKSEAHARDVETSTIRLHQPKYNLRGKYSEFQREMIFANDFKEALEQRLG